MNNENDSDLDTILYGRVKLADYYQVKDEIKQMMVALVSIHAQDQQLVSKLKRIIIKL